LAQGKQNKGVMKRKNGSGKNMETNKKALQSIHARNNNINKIVQPKINNRW